MKRSARSRVLVMCLTVAALAAAAVATAGWIPVFCGGDCIDLYCVPPAPPETACIQIGGGCGSTPWHPDCANMDLFSPI